MQDLDKALAHLEDIHAHVLRTEYYQGFSSVSIALTGLSGLLAALLQTLYLPVSATMFVLFWAVIASLNVVAISLQLGFEYLHSHTPFERRKTHAVLVQFLPTLLAGLLLTVFALQWQEAVLLHAMPGLWALLFALGVFACRPFFPTRMFLLGGYYLIAAVCLLSLAPTGHSLNPWAMGLVFGSGQLFAAWVIYTEIEHHG